jgi:hypothetical protein
MLLDRDSCWVITKYVYINLHFLIAYYSQPVSLSQLLVHLAQFKYLSNIVFVNHESIFTESHQLSTPFSASLPF